MNIENEFKNKYGVELNNVLPDGNDEQNKVKRFIEKQKLNLITFCKSYNVRFSYDNLSDASKQIFDGILLDQMWYVLNAEDFTEFSGLDVATGTTIALTELTSRYISPIVQMQLKNEGFCYRGL